MAIEEKRIIFFDGQCNLCNGFINFVIRFIERDRVYIASLQGRLGQKILNAKLGKDLSSVVFKDSDGRLYYKSRAIFKILNEMGGLWSALALLRFLPQSLADWVYDFIAARRYLWFGRRQTCRVPTEEERAFFLD